MNSGFGESIEFEDFNGDVYPDIVATAENSGALYFISGKTYSETSFFASNEEVDVMALASNVIYADNPDDYPVATSVSDVNGDGTPDLIVATRSGDALVFDGTKLETYKSFSEVPHRIAVNTKGVEERRMMQPGDFDCDGQGDILFESRRP